MSKIQKALGKLQGTRVNAPPPINHQPDIEDSIIIAKLVDRGTKNYTYDVTDICLHVDNESLRNAGLIAPEYHEELLANQYRDIKRPIIAHAFGKRATRIVDGNLIMVSSALAGEGKTFTSINLALSMAHERDHTVLLVDADVAKPHTSEMFGASDELGLLDVLENPDIPIQSLILPTDVDNLSILPAGRPRPHATELLASVAMENVSAALARLSEGHIIVFDTPPLLQTSEAKVLASLAGQIILVVRAEQTSHDAVLAALAALDEGKAVNLVLNQVRARFSEYQYGYGFGNGYGSAYRNKKDDKSHQVETDLFG